MSEPKISIIIPVYNVEKYLAECLDSCINQTLEDIEIICVDDASPDNSIKILEEYQQKDSRIKIIRHEKNKNLGGARNTGLENATGEYVWFVDSDDYIDTKACQILYDAIKEFNVDMLCFSALPFTDTNKLRKFIYNGYFHQGVQVNKIYHPRTNWKEINFSNLNVSACMYLSRRDAIQKFRFREEIIFEDTDFTTILLASVDSFCYIPYTAYFQRINPDSITHKPISDDSLLNVINCLQFLEKFISENGIKKDHFIFRFFFDQICYNLKIYGYSQNISAKQLKALISMQKKYQTYKYLQKKFIGKILKNMHKTWAILL